MEQTIILRLTLKILKLRMLDQNIGISLARRQRGLAKNNARSEVNLDERCTGGRRPGEWEKRRICRGGVKLELEIIVPEEQRQKPKSKDAKAPMKEEGLQNKSSMQNSLRRHFVWAAHEKRKKAAK